MAVRKCTVCIGCFFPCAFLLGAALVALGVAMYLEFPSLLIDVVDKASDY